MKGDLLSASEFGLQVSLESEYHFTEYPSLIL